MRSVFRIDFSTLEVQLMPTRMRFYNAIEERTNHCGKEVQVRCKGMLKYALSKSSDSDPDNYGNKTGTSRHLASSVQYRTILQCFYIKCDKSEEK